MAIETAAALLTKIAFVQNSDFRSRLSSVQGDENALEALIMPLYRRILSQLREDQQAHDKFPSALAPSPTDREH
jgi:hypothetical protein